MELSPNTELVLLCTNVITLLCLLVWRARATAAEQELHQLKEAINEIARKQGCHLP